MGASSASYATFALVDGTAPLPPVPGTHSFGWADLGGARDVGALCGLGARRSRPGLARRRAAAV